MSRAVVEIEENKLPSDDRALWLKAVSAVQMGNHGYAVNLVQPLVTRHPGFVEGRRTLRKSAALSVDGADSKGSTFFGVSVGGGAPSKLKTLAKKDPAAALGEIEKELVKDPLNAGLNDLLHDSAVALGMPRTAAFALETLHEYKPKEGKLLHKLANYYTTQEQFNEAAKVYSTIREHFPTDSAAIKGEKDCMAKGSMVSNTTKTSDGGLNLQMRDDSLRIELEKKARTGLTKDQMIERRDQLVAAYSENQHDLPTVRSLAEAYENLEDYPNAYSFYSWAHQLSESDSSLRAKTDKMRNKANAQQIKTLRAELKNDPENAELQAQITELEKANLAERIKECEARVEENPTDGTLRYELGQAYFQNGEAEKAIPHLQQAKSNPAIETKVLLLLGKTFDAKGMTDMAVTQLQRANEKLLAMDSTKKEVVYELALLQEKAGKSEEYLTLLKEIYEVDYGYRDVAPRVEAAY